MRNENNKYKLEISGYESSKSNIPDGLAHHNNSSFSTFDSDNENYHCKDLSTQCIIILRLK